MKKERVYITGKVGDLSDDNYHESVYQKFERREKRLQSMGFVVGNPVKLVPRDLSWNEAMKLCISAMLTCDKINPLPDTWYSRGGMIEFNLSQTLNMPVIIPETEYEP
jgi:Fe2+ transport system protein FeoA